MALRTFVDQTGNEWQAFDVVPRADERRRYDRRSAAAQVEEESDDRRDADRRITVGGRSRISSGVTAGWLCFEHGTERRRLSPIPNDWSTCSDEQLEAYCREARPARLPAANEEQAAGRKK